MTNYLASRPDFAELAKLETSTATLRRNALTAYDAHRAELARLDDPRDREHRDLDGSERVAARLKLREETLARLGKLGDLDAQRAAITSAAEALDLRRLLEAGRFTPATSGNAEHVALGLIADDVARRRYRERLARRSADELVGEAERIVRDAGSDPSASDALARADELDQLSRKAIGPDGSRVRSAAISMMSRIESAWKARADAVAAVDRAARHVSLADEITNTVRYSLPEPAALAAGRVAIRAA